MPEAERPTDPAADRALLEESARIAGEIGLGFVGGPNAVEEKPGGHGPVSEADRAVNAYLHDRLRAARPDYGWLSEESEDGAARLATPRVFIIDPIDGTRAYLAGQSSWGVSLAVAEAGRIIAGAVYMPALDRLYSAADGGGALCDGQPICVSGATDADRATVLANAASLDAMRWRDAPPRLTRHFRPSLAYRLCLVAEGRFDAALSFRDTWEWDLAAGGLIAQEAGALVTTAAGGALVYNRAQPMLPGFLAAGPALHATIRSRLRT